MLRGIRCSISDLEIAKEKSWDYHLFDNKWTFTPAMYLCNTLMNITTYLSLSLQRQRGTCVLLFYEHNNLKLKQHIRTSLHTMTMWDGAWHSTYFSTLPVTDVLWILIEWSHLCPTYLLQVRNFRVLQNEGSVIVERNQGHHPAPECVGPPSIENI